VVAARLLDLTRLVSRLGRGPLTGVDRVEFAYLVELLRRDAALFALVRTAAGYLLMDRSGAQSVANLVAGMPLGRTDILSRLTNRLDPLRGQAEAAVRRVSIARVPHLGLQRLLRRLPEGASYLNIGHANLSDRTLRCLRTRCRIAVLLHDTIPLDHPEFSRPDTVASFHRKLVAVATHADLIIHTTHHTRITSEAHLRDAGRVPAGIVAKLGVPQPQPTHSPAGLVLKQPYFVALGTVEPRKNHALLLRVWSELARHGPPPQLLVAGARGWADPHLFGQLATVPGVQLLSGVPDGEVAALVQGSAALLFPTFAEGFGLPPVEAAALGTPVVASDLAVTREVMGEYPIYLGVADSYSWLETIIALSSKNAPGDRQARVPPPTWKDHFNTVLNLV